MGSSDIFVSVVYVLYVLSPSIRQELWLRTALLSTSIGFTIWGLWIESWPVIVANVLFGLMSLRQIRRAYLDQRPVILAEDAEIYGKQLFPAMTDKDLDRLWLQGESLTSPTTELTTVGKTSPYLYAVLSGDLTVRLSDGTEMAQSTPTIIGEISTLATKTGVANATVVAQDARVHRWLKSDLNELQQRHMSLTGPFLRGLSAQMAGRFLVEPTSDTTPPTTTNPDRALLQ